MYEQLRGEPESRVDTGYTLSRIFGQVSWKNKHPNIPGWFQVLTFFIIKGTLSLIIAVGVASLITSLITGLLETIS